MALAVAIALGLAGCGGSDGEGKQAGQPPAPKPAAPKPPSKAETIRQADAICGKANDSSQRTAKALNRELAALAQQQTAPAQAASLKRAATLFERRAKERGAITEKLEELPEPADGRPDAYLAGRRRVDRLLLAAAKASRKAKPPLDAAEAGRVSKAFAAVNAAATRDQKAARKYGFKVCGKPIKTK